MIDGYSLVWRQSLFYKSFDEIPWAWAMKTGKQKVFSVVFAFDEEFGDIRPDSVRILVSKAIHDYLATSRHPAVQRTLRKLVEIREVKEQKSDR